MLPSVSEVLDLDVVRSGAPAVLCGQRQLHSQVRWVHVLEVPDPAHLLQGGELVLTTGIALPDDAAGLARFVDSLVEVGAAGLVLELGQRYTESAPNALVKAARKNDWPVIVLRRETQFVAITKAVHSLVIDVQVAELRHSDEVHRAFHELDVTGCTPPEVLREVVRLTGRAVVLEDVNHRVLAFDGAGTDQEQLLADWQRRSRRVHGARHTVHDQDTGWLTTPVGARGDDWGRLILVDELGTPATRRLTGQQVVLERAAATLALNRLLNRETMRPDRQAQHGLVSALLDHSLTVAEVQLRARALGIPLAGKRLVGMAVQYPERGAGVPEEPLADRVADTTENLRRGALIGQTPSATVLLLALEQEDTADSLLTSVAERLSSPEETHAPVVAAGFVVSDGRDARASLSEAMHVAEVVARRPELRRAPYVELRHLHLLGLMHELRDDSRVQAFAERELGTLLAHDARHGTTLTTVLRAYLNAGASKAQTARALHLSRPAIYDKLQRVERILNVDLSKEDSRSCLYVAMMIHDIATT